MEKCFLVKFNKERICSEEGKKEIIPNLIRRLALPFYIPAIALICSFLLIRNNIFFLDKFTIYLTSFLLLVFTELFIRYTGINLELGIFYVLLPFILIIIFYSTLLIQFNKGKINI